MARYRTYKNGITGHKYKGYYIIRGESKGLFQIWNEDGTVHKKDLYDYDECEWVLDKETATAEERRLMEQLYDREIYQLSSLFVELIQKEKLEKKDRELYKWIEKIRKRKIEDRRF